MSNIQEELKTCKSIKKQFQEQKNFYKKRAILSILPLPILFLLIKELFTAVQTPIEFEGILITKQILLIIVTLSVAIKTAYEICNYIRTAIEIKDLNAYVKEITQEDKEKQKQNISTLTNSKQRTTEEKIQILNEAKQMLIQHLQEEIPKAKKLTK